MSSVPSEPGGATVSASSHWPAIRERCSLTLREFAFRVICRHRQGSKPNILLYCNRRGGSTWLLNAIAHEPGLRYVGRPFTTLPRTRHRHRLAATMRRRIEESRGHLLSIRPEEEEHFRPLAAEIVSGATEVHPSLALRASYFQRHTDRMSLQMTTAGPLLDWFSTLPVVSVVLLRHPIPTALSIERSGWPPRLAAFLKDEALVETHLSGAQIDLIRRLEREGASLPRHVAEIALQLALPYRRHLEVPDTIHLTSYEELIVDPRDTLGMLGSRLDLEAVERVHSSIAKPSRTIDGDTRKRLDEPAFLLRRWRHSVSVAEECDLLQIAATLGFDAYVPGEDLPRSARPARSIQSNDR